MPRLLSHFGSYHGCATSWHHRESFRWLMVHRIGGEREPDLRSKCRRVSRLLFTAAGRHPHASNPLGKLQACNGPDRP